MNTPRALSILCLTAVIVTVSGTTVKDTTKPAQKHNVLLPRKFELFDGVYAELPQSNSTDKLITFQLETNRDSSEGRKKKSKGSKKLLAKILPLFIMPFVLQSAIIPLFLGFLKVMLFKSLIVGKLALSLILLNAFKNSNSFKGRDAVVADVHYGYHGNGMEEYGAYVN